MLTDAGATSWAGLQCAHSKCVTKVVQTGSVTAWHMARAYGVFDENEKMAMRATFILDCKRTIVYSVASPVNVGRSVTETLRVVCALRSGRLCPADWEPGGLFGPADKKY